MDSTLYYLVIFGSVQLGLVFFALVWYISPFTCCNTCYPEEPAPRIVQLAYPSLRRIPFVLLVHNTVVHQSWYATSISQYAGARGTTAGKIMALTTTASGVLQFVLALLIWFYNRDGSGTESITVDHVRFALLTLGAIACIVIGQAESAILWKFGREEQIRTEWVTFDHSTRDAELHRALRTLKSLDRNHNSPGIANIVPQSIQTHSQRWIHPKWKSGCPGHHQVANDLTDQLIQPIRENIKTLVAAVDKSNKIHRKTLQCSQQTVKLHSEKEDQQIAVDIANRAVGVLDESRIDAAINDLEDTLQRGIVDPINPPIGYIVFRTYEKGGNDLLINGSIPTLVLEDDSLEKGVYGTVHMFSAILLIGCNCVAHCIGGPWSLARWWSMIVACVGTFFFIVFCLMQYISGNYDQGIKDHLTDKITTGNASCLCYSMCHHFRCAQSDPDKYPCNRCYLGMSFIFVEMIAFGGVVISTGIEGIVMYAHPENY